MYKVELEQGYNSCELKYERAEDLRALLANLHFGKPEGDFKIVITFDYGKEAE